MTVPPSNSKEDTWVRKTVLTELNTKRSCPLPAFANSIQEAAWLRFRADAILEEWLFSKTGEKIPTK